MSMISYASLFVQISCRQTTSYNYMCILLGIGAGGLTVDNVNIPGCTAVPCELPEGKNTTFTLTYTASEYMHYLHTNTRA